MKINIVDKINANKDLNHCWQYQKRLDLLEKDLIEDNLTQDFVNTLKMSDFIFTPLNYKNKIQKKQIDNFILR